MFQHRGLEHHLLQTPNHAEHQHGADGAGVGGKAGIHRPIVDLADQMDIANIRQSIHPDRQSPAHARTFSTVLPPKLEVALMHPLYPLPSCSAQPASRRVVCTQHRHAWGEFVYAFSGVMEVKLPGHHYLAPSQ